MARYKSRAKRAGEAEGILTGAAESLLALAEEVRDLAKLKRSEREKARDGIAQRVAKVFSDADDAASEATSLGEEMRSWADGMSGTNLENTSKFQEVEEAADTVENLDLDFEEPEFGEDDEEYASALEAEAEKMETAGGELGNVEFPGMY